VIGSTPSRPPFPVTLDNWQTAEQVGWTFCHLAEIFPTGTISRGSEPAVPIPRRITPVADLSCRDADGESTTVGAIMQATDTDGWMVVHGGTLLAEQYAGAMEPDTLGSEPTSTPTLESTLRARECSTAAYPPPCVILLASGS
jgi:hypothetical protein